MPDTEPDDRADGRTARRDRNREAVLDAVLDLFREDAMYPNPADVAARSGVSTRSVQRYYEDMDALVQAAMARHLEKVGPLFAVPDLGVGSLDERVDRLIAARLRLHDAIAPMVRAVLLRIRDHAQLRDRMAEARAQMRDQVAAMFAPELEALAPDAGRDLLDALDGVLAFEFLEHLRVTLHRSEPETERALRRATLTLLGAAPELRSSGRRP